MKNEKRKIKWIFHSSLLTFHFTSVFDILIQAKLLVKSITTAESMSYGFLSEQSDERFEEIRKGRKVDAVAHGGDEGRDKLR